MLPHLPRAGEWFLRSGIQEANGGVARYYRLDLGRNHEVSSEITGYAASTFIYLHSVTGDERYLERATAAAAFLARTAWDAPSQAMPFEIATPAFTYFFDCGIVARGLLAVWRATGVDEFLEIAAAVGRSMLRDFAAANGEFHPILSLPDKRPLEREAGRWSRWPGCYQLKAAMAWWELHEATGDAAFRTAYERLLEGSLRTSGDFLPGHSDRRKVVDRLHAFLYFLEGLLPGIGEQGCAAALSSGIERVAQLSRQIAPEFERSDVFAQLLRLRLYADWAGAAPLDREAAQYERERLTDFQAPADEGCAAGGFYFGRGGGCWLPYVNPVSTVFALQALEWWDRHMRNDPQPPPRFLI
ncbi:MAG TPA: hypothetical protein VLY04_07005 [Bryobacteraceae bacterium]|nr:hypothetical protein [Bryobacteraceae bacterium]